MSGTRLAMIIVRNDICRQLLYQTVTVEDADALFDKWCGIPRFVFEKTHDPSQLKDLLGAIKSGDLWML